DRRGRGGPDGRREGGGLAAHVRPCGRGVGGGLHQVHVGARLCDGVHDLVVHVGVAGVSGDHGVRGQGCVPGGHQTVSSTFSVTSPSGNGAGGTAGAVVSAGAPTGICTAWITSHDQ